MKSDIEQSYIADIISSRYPTSEPEGIVEVGELTRDPAQFSATATKQDGGVGFVQGAAPAPMSSSSTAPTTGRVFPEDTASIQNIPRTQLEEMMGNIGSAIQTGAEYLDFAVIGLPDVGTLSLKDLTVGDLGKVMEAMSYGFTPTTGEGQTLRPTPEALDLLNAIPAFQAANKAIKYGVKGLKAGAEALAPAAADVIESGLRKTGMITDIVPDGKSVMQQAPKSDIGFYSAVENAAINVQRKSGTGQSFLNDIMKGENVKVEEIKWIGLDDFLKSKKNVTKQEVQDYIANNKVDVQEVQLGGAQQYDAKRLDQLEFEYKSLKQHPIDDPSFGEEKYNELIKLMNIRDQSTTQSLYAAAEEATRRGQIAQKQGKKNRAEAYFKESEFLNTRAEKLDLENQGMSNPTKFGQYTLAGGENYREILLTMPDKTPTVFTVQADSLTKEFNTMDEATAYKNTLMQQYPNSSPNIIQNKSLAPNDVNYKSPHFPDQRNILAHLRVNDRVDADGKKMLLIEEVQSDWHQAGRDKGYGINPSRFILRNPKTGGQVGDFATKAEAEEFMKTSFRSEEFSQGGFFVDEIKGKVGVPDAPFKDTWYQLALKRALQYAAENGYERVGLTTGKQQVERFDLSKQVNAVSYHPDDKGRGMFLNVFGKNNEVIYSKLTPENEVANVIGKETAKKLLEQKPIDDNRVLQGLDLKIGGEGMKKYYDEIYPKFLEKYGKKWNAKMGETKIQTERSRDASGIPSMYQDKETVRYIDVTPEMKAGVQKGQPLFAAAPIGAATGAATMQDERKK